MGASCLLGIYMAFLFDVLIAEPLLALSVHLLAFPLAFDDTVHLSDLFQISPFGVSLTLLVEMENVGAELLVRPEALVVDLATAHRDGVELALLDEAVFTASCVALLGCVLVEVSVDLALHKEVLGRLQRVPPKCGILLPHEMVAELNKRPCLTLGRFGQ